MTTKEQRLGEHWFYLRNLVWREVRSVVEASGIDRETIAIHAGMTESQLAKVLAGKTSDVTMRTLHNIARAANHRLRIIVEPLPPPPEEG